MKRVVKGKDYFYEDLRSIYQHRDANGNFDGTLDDPEDHPDWRLKDAAGNPLFLNFAIPYQWAADIMNPDYQNRWLRWALSQIPNYGLEGGIQIDDVNPAMDLADANGGAAIPMDRLTGKPMDPKDWITYLVSFTSIIRTVIKRVYPKFRIIHNTPWLTLNSMVALQADVIMAERAFGDPNIVGGTGTFSLFQRLAALDAVHTMPRPVHVYEWDVDQFMYIVACAWLANAEYIEFDPKVTLTPQQSAVLDVDLGTGQPRIRDFGLIWRKFDKGMVVVAEAGAGTATVPLIAPMTDVLTGQRVSSVTLGPRQGVVLHV